MTTSNRFPFMRWSLIMLRAPPERHHRDRRQRNRDAVGTAMPLDCPRLNADAVSHVTAAEAFGVAIEDFIVNPGGRYAKFVSGADYRREIAAEQHEVVRIRRFPEKGNDRV